MCAAADAKQLIAIGRDSESGGLLSFSVCVCVCVFVSLLLAQLISLDATFASYELYTSSIG